MCIVLNVLEQDLVICRHFFRDEYRIIKFAGFGGGSGAGGGGGGG